MKSYPPAKRVYASALALLLLAVFCVFISQIPTTHAAATTFTVNSLADTSDATFNGLCADSNGACTLRAAIEEANFQSGDDTIQFSVTGTINLTQALPTLQTNINIAGPGSSSLIVRRDTGGNYRIFAVNATVNMSGLTITNGRTPDGTNDQVGPGGGGIFQTGGNLTLRDVVITANTTGNGFSNPLVNFGGFGGFGGGILGSGTLTMIDCVVSNNTTGNGGSGGQFGGSGGRGAGIYFAPGTLTMKNVIITGNRTGNSGGPSSGNSGYGGGLWTGGDFFPQPQNTIVNMENVQITNNSTGNNITTGDAAGGGGYYIHQGIVTLKNTTVSNNHTGTANPNGNSFGTTGSGAGIFNNGVLTIINSVISNNSTAQGTGGGSIVTGGGITTHNSLTMINSTVSGNSSLGDSSMGGGVFVFNLAKLINCTITGNIASNNNGNGLSGHDSGNITVANTIVAGNGPGGAGPDLSDLFFGPPVFNSLGHNLIGNADGITAFNATGDQTGTTASPLNPQLGLLANNGGPTFTHALLAGSPALDAGSNALATDGTNPLTTDQRGAQRIADSPDAGTTATVDIGAFEFLQVPEDITNKSTNEDTPITVTFGLGDVTAATSVTASSNNQALVPDANLVLSGTGAARSLLITPAANQSGIATITVTVNLAGGGSVVDTFQLTVVPVNDPPTFNLAGDVNVNEDAGPQTIPNFATAIDAGPSESQSLTFTVTPQNDIFATAPAISPSGTLTFTTKPNVSGSAQVTVVLKDNGGTTNGGQDTSVQKTFSINVTEINDPPTFTKGADQTVNEDPGFQFVFNWATNISTGPNEFQSATFQVTNNTNPTLFSTQPSVNSSGSLSYAPAVNASGSADITIVLKDNGGTANGGSDTSAPQTFKITVNPVNDAPTITIPVPSSTNQHTPLVFSAATFNPILINDVDAGTDSVAIAITVNSGTLSLSSTTGLTFIEGDGVDDATLTFTGTIAAINAALNGSTFKPANGFSGVATIQIGVDDQGHNGPGGAKRVSGSLNILVRSGGLFTFNTANYGVNENGGTATITVLRANGNAGTATVNYSTANGTATAGASCSSGVDYLPASGTFTWNNGDSSARTFTITICNDGLSEEDETINLTLSNAGGTGSLSPQPNATLTIGNDDGPVLLTEENSQHAIALDTVNHTRDPFSLLNPFNLSPDQRRRVSLFVWRLGLLPSDTAANVTVVARDSEGRTYNLAVEALHPSVEVMDVTQVVVRLPDTVVGAPRDLLLKVTLRGPSTNEAFIKIAAP